MISLYKVNYPSLIISSTWIWCVTCCLGKLFVHLIVRSIGNLTDWNFHCLGMIILHLDYSTNCAFSSVRIQGLLIHVEASIICLNLTFCLVIGGLILQKSGCFDFHKLSYDFKLLFSHILSCSSLFELLIYLFYRSISLISPLDAH